ncbi:MAG: ATP-dependent protease ATPase subunit HslU [Bacillota bacterium]
MSELTPREIVTELDRHIVGQEEAKRSVAVALRNRYRRSRLPRELREEILPKNILMIGATGVGKTEIARRLARLVRAPFLKVEATKFTEVGYVGRDVESMVRDLVEAAIRMVKAEEMAKVDEEADRAARRRLLDIIAPVGKRRPKRNPFEALFAENVDDDDNADEDFERSVERQRRRELAERLDSGELDDQEVEIEVEEQVPSMVEVFGGGGVEELGINLQSMFGNIFPAKKNKRRVSIAEARSILRNEEAQKLIDMDRVHRMAIKRAENEGIIFLDELDKVAGEDSRSGPDVSREGVQRDILPIVEGTTVMTKYGPVRTDHTLFIAAGAFHTSKPSDLVPELQGRFPIRVEMHSLSRDDLRRILVEPRSSLTRQYEELLQTDGVNLEFTEDGLDEIARISEEINTATENIGARRLHTVMEKLLQDVSFDAPDDVPEHVVIDAEYVRDKLAEIVSDRDLSHYIL